MGGRGKGRGLSFNVESLGFTPGEALPGPVLQPPPAYPILEYHPVPMFDSLENMQRLQYKTNFLDFLSKYKVDTKKTSNPPVQLEYDWAKFPAELRPAQFKRKAQALKAKPIANIDDLLEQLERAEDKVKKEKPDKEDDDKDKQVEEPIEEEDSDHEMDGGTDYNQNYFDNGEGYLDEDDDMDDGPIY